MPGVEPAFLPAVDDIEALVQLLEKSRDLGGIILQVGIHHQNQVAARGPHSRRQSSCLAKIPPKPDCPHLGVICREFVNHIPGSIRRPIVHEQDLKYLPTSRAAAFDLRVQFSEAVLFIKNGDNDTQHAGNPGRGTIASLSR